MVGGGKFLRAACAVGFLRYGLGSTTMAVGDPAVAWLRGGEEVRGIKISANEYSSTTGVVLD